MSDSPERIWAVHWNTEGAVLNGAWADTVRHFGGGVEYVRADVHESMREANRNLALEQIAAHGQAADAYDAQRKAEADLARAVELIERAKGILDPCFPKSHDEWQKDARAALASIKERGAQPATAPEEEPDLEPISEETRESVREWARQGDVRHAARVLLDDPQARRELCAHADFVRARLESLAQPAKEAD